jgi:two-component system, OmpR family, sensor histidine kinase KdpD
MTRPDPDALLRRVEAEEEFRHHGRLKIFLGYAPGVGKSFRMLDEGRRRRVKGEDVVVGAIQPTAAPAIEMLLGCMEVIPLKNLNGVPVIDVPAILRRHPQVCLVDGLAYDNPPGSVRAKRWQDVEELRAAGISVIGSVNLQFIEELRDKVEKITGKEVTETIPLGFVNTADEIEVVDAPADRCAGHPDEPARQQNLLVLREMALLLAANVVDDQLEKYRQRHGIEPVGGARERIMVCIKPGMAPERMIESGHRNAERFSGELFAVTVNEPDMSPQDQAALDRALSLARKLGAQVYRLESEEPTHAIMEFACQHGITQIFIGHSSHEHWTHRLWGGFVDRLIREAEGMDVRVFPN